MEVRDILRSPFLGKRRMQSFVHQSIMFWLYAALKYRSSMSSNFLVFHASAGISSRPAAFLFLILHSTTSSCVNCPSLMSSGLLMIFVIGSSVTLGYIYIYRKASPIKKNVYYIFHFKFMTSRNVTFQDLFLHFIFSKDLPREEI